MVGAVVVVWQLNLQLPVQLVPITTKVMSSNPVHGEVWSIQHYVIKFASDLRWFSPSNPVSSTNKTDRSDRTEILLKVALNTINQTINHMFIIPSIHLKTQICQNFNNQYYFRQFVIQVLPVNDY
jgi:hypothetical protein